MVQKKLLNFGNANHSTVNSRNSGSKVEWKEKFREKFPKIWVYLARLSSFWTFWKMLLHSLLEVAEIQTRLFGSMESALRELSS